MLSILPYIYSVFAVCVPTLQNLLVQDRMFAHCALVSAMPMLCLLDTHSDTSACNMGARVVKM